MKSLSCIAAAIGLMAIAIGPLHVAQAEDEAAGPSYLKFRIQTVKRGHQAQWEKVRMEMRDAARAAGWSFYHVYERHRGPMNGFLIVTPEEAIGEPAGDIEMAEPYSMPDSWFSAIMSHAENSLVLSLEYLPELRTIPDGPVHPGAKYMHLRIRTAAPGRAGDFERWLGEDLVPALRAAEVGDVRNARVVLGGSPRTFVTASFVDGWPYSGDTDPRIERALEKGRPMVATWVDYFYEFREDLSFTVE